MTSHESRILPFFPQPPPGQLKHKPEEVTLPPYHPDTPEMRHDWALYYDLIGVMDAEVGNLLRDLEESGEADNTIVMYYGDNGGVLARSKRFVYETGTQVPFIVRIPEKYKHLYPAQKPGQKIDRLINFTDLAPTLLSVLDEHIPAYMQGKAFLGKQATQAPEYTFLTRQRMDERYDLVRAVRDQQFRYIRNYMPFRITMQHVNFMFQALSTQSWEKAFRHGKANTVQSRDFKPKPVEELYNTENDPWEVNNLAADPAYKGVLIRMRSALRAWMMEIRDVGLIPETEYASIAGDVPLYDYMRSPACPFDKLMEASEKAVMGGQEDINTYVTYLKDKNSAIRYWGATGLLILKDGARPAVTALRKASSDPSGAVATLAAEALYGLGEEEIALKAFKNILQNPAIHDDNDATFAMNSIDALNIDNPAIETAVKDFLDRQSSTTIDSQKAPGVPGEGNAYRGDAYPVRIGKYLLQKWEKKE
jgi:N-sulfoglucosamine sulfohydrolase